MAAKTRPTVISEVAQRVRNAEAELELARRELEVAVTEAGWRELYRRSGPTGEVVTYLREGGPLDPVTRLPMDSEVRTLQDFARDGA